MGAFTCDVCSNLKGQKANGGVVGAMVASAKKFDQKQKFQTCGG